MIKAATLALMLTATPAMAISDFNVDLCTWTIQVSEAALFAKSEGLPVEVAFLSIMVAASEELEYFGLDADFVDSFTNEAYLLSYRGFSDVMIPIYLFGLCIQELDT